MSAPLSSWKEIAAYLGKGVRTVQRWEQQFGLPIRRPNSESHVIFALPQELDAWVRRQHKSNHHSADALKSTKTDARETSKKVRLKQHELLSRLRSTYSRLEANERVLGRSVTRLIEGFPANSVNSKPKQLSQSRAEGQARPNIQKMQSKGAA
jgi:hypothetical protein